MTPDGALTARRGTCRWTATDTAPPSIETGIWPDAIAITPDGKTAYVAISTGGVTPIRTAMPPIKTGRNPGAIAITRSGVGAAHQSIRADGQGQRSRCPGRLPGRAGGTT